MEMSTVSSKYQIVNPVEIRKNMLAKNYILDNIDFLNEEQIAQLANFTAFLKVRSKAQTFNTNPEISKLYKKYDKEDIGLAEQGLEEYNESLLQEDKL